MKARGEPGAAGNFFGAFADGAILFPLLAALATRSDFSATRLLLTAGLAYWAAGVVFRIPMSVQPLKSIAIAAIAIGASMPEVRVSGALLGGACLAMSFFDADALAERVPVSLVHALQLGLGVILCRQGVQYGWKAGIARPELWPVLLLLPAILCWLPGKTRLPLLGITATTGLAWAVLGPHARGAVPGSALHAAAGFRWSVVAALVLPQIALTSANSVLGTRDVALRYYGRRASRVTVTRLLRSIGIGNLLSASVGGLPYCHGSGGLTAHARGGATSWAANAIIGTALLGFALIRAAGGELQFSYPPVLLSALLFTTGVFHIGLAAPTWASRFGRERLALVALVAAMSQNMLWVLGAGLVGEWAARGILRREERLAPVLSRSEEVAA